MSKRALMLTAAAAALLSGPAFAQCSIDAKVTSPQDTQTCANVNGTQGGTITITSTGSIVVTTNPPTGPAVTIDDYSNNGVDSAADVINQGTISYLGVGDSTNPLTGIEMVTGLADGTAVTGGFDNAGKVDFTGAGSYKTGILFANPNNTSSDFTGDITQTAGGTPLLGMTGIPDSNPAAILLESGSTFSVQGDNSIGINIATGTSLGVTTASDIDIIGDLKMTPTSAASTASASYGIDIAGTMNGDINIAPGGNIEVQGNGQSYGIYIPAAGTNGSPPAGVLNGNIYIDGNITMAPVSTTSTMATQDAAIYVAGSMNGNIDLDTGGNILATGAGAQGIRIDGTLTGYIENQGRISTIGTQTQSNKGNNPQAWFALDIGGSVSGGIYNAGPNGQGSTTPIATMSTTGNTATINISPSSTQTTNLDIGAYPDTNGDIASILNRGTITNASENPDSSTYTISMSGVSSTVQTILDSGIFNAGSIESSAFTDSKGNSHVNATAILIGSDAVVCGGATSTCTNYLGNGYALTNSNEVGSKPGLISASVFGDMGGEAHAIEIDTGGNLPSILNEGTIEAAASTTNSTLTGGAVQAYAIFDSSGTLTQITNNTGASIDAFATVLSDQSQIAIAIDVAAATKTVTIDNSGTIVGDIWLGSGNDTLNVTGASSQQPASVSGTIYFGGTGTSDDVLNVGVNGFVTGQIYSGTSTDKQIGMVDLNVTDGGTLDMLTAATTESQSNNKTLMQGIPLTAGVVDIQNGGNLDVHYSQSFNSYFFPDTPIINAKTATIEFGANVTFTPDSFIAPPLGDPFAQFVIIDTQAGGLTISSNELFDINKVFMANLPYLYIPSSDFSNPTESGLTLNPAGNELLLNIYPKTIGLDGCKTRTPVGNCNPAHIPLTGFAADMFPYVNVALGNDNGLGAAMINGITNSYTAENAYTAFAPDVSGSTRALAVSLTDDGTSVVAARQRELRQYANQEDDMTLWGQQFVQRLSQDATGAGPGYSASGFGFAVGLDEGDPVDGRYGGAFTFFSGGERGQLPDLTKTTSEWYMLTGYTDWRGKGLFLDTNASVGYVSLQGKRFLNLALLNNGVYTAYDREAVQQHPGELLSGGLTTGVLLDDVEGMVVTPQVSLDGLVMREESYSESGGGNGMNLHVASSYTQSLRGFAGVDVRKDFDFTDFLLQPDVSVGYRYDFANGAQNLRANFESVASPPEVFQITGPQPDKGNLVTSGGIAVATGAWSLGLSFDYLRAGSGNTAEQGTLTLLGRI